MSLKLKLLIAMAFKNLKDFRGTAGGLRSIELSIILTDNNYNKFYDELTINVSIKRYDNSYFRESRRTATKYSAVFPSRSQLIYIVS